MSQLLDLQEVDVAVLRLEARKRVLLAGEEVEAARDEVLKNENALGELGLELDRLSTEQRRVEYDVDALSQKAAAEEKRMYDGSVANAKELESMQRDIENLKHRRERLEDELLEYMEKREALETQIAAVRVSLEEASAVAKDISEGSDAELAEIEVKLTNFAAQRAGLAAGIDPELLELYDDLRAQKKGVGAAALVDGICQGCHEKLSSVQLDKLKHGGGIARCDTCRRILVL
jgi:predicted  nucleic acid-binding Zn-ribbon protein